MITLLHRISAICFFALGLSFFVAYIGARNGIFALQSAIWMQSADLPFALSAIVYGGLSFYRSLTSEKGSKPLAWGIGIPLGLFFCLLLALDFWKM